jgi:hypothetical protein
MSRSCQRVGRGADRKIESNGVAGGRLQIPEGLAKLAKASPNSRGPGENGEGVRKFTTASRNWRRRREIHDGLAKLEKAPGNWRRLREIGEGAGKLETASGKWRRRREIGDGLGKMEKTSGNWGGPTLGPDGWPASDRTATRTGLATAPQGVKSYLRWLSGRSAASGPDVVLLTNEPDWATRTSDMSFRAEPERFSANRDPSGRLRLPSG